MPTGWKWLVEDLANPAVLRISIFVGVVAPPLVFSPFQSRPRNGNRSKLYNRFAIDSNRHLAKPTQHPYWKIFHRNIWASMMTEHFCPGNGTKTSLPLVSSYLLGRVRARWDPALDRTTSSRSVTDIYRFDIWRSCCEVVMWGCGPLLLKHWGTEDEAY